MKAFLKETSAYKAGRAIQINILKHGVTPGIAKSIRKIVENHNDETLKSFFEGAFGVSIDEEN